ncbi:G-type lectin S-receptor-like serine/threonine-protein kinase At1g11410 [Durio zibethinus]|uniref:G-type lectin S-receptor-like serine/threonine-protein kinase At1g11410 n=1 Tax=Durio zibethinus TaxID=66656 RepID=A0A6P5XPB2_DURZI|nr:G-type lectin S-receptor-like serine/threonine-protein kinase At1g11410 [Durio zibethinus]
MVQWALSQSNHSFKITVMALNLCIILLMWSIFAKLDRFGSILMMWKPLKLRFLMPRRGGYSVTMPFNSPMTIIGCFLKLKNAIDLGLSMFTAYGIGTSHRAKHQLLVIVMVTIAAAILLMWTIICYLQTKIFKSQGVLGTVKKSSSSIINKISAEGEHDNGAPHLQVFSFTSIKAATNNFSDENKLGEGGYGPVYKGKLPKGQEIAVKRLSKLLIKGLRNSKMRSHLRHSFNM